MAEEKQTNAVSASEPQPLAPAPAVHDKRILPEGVVPKQAQGYVVAGLAVLILLAVMFSKNHPKPAPKEQASSPTAISTDANQRKIQELEQDLSADQRQSQQQALAQKTGAGTSPVGSAASAGTATPVAATPVSQPTESPRDPVADAEKALAFKARFASNLVSADDGTTRLSAPQADFADAAVRSNPDSGPVPARPAGISQQAPATQAAAPGGKRPPEVNVNSAQGQPYVLFEGTTIDTALVNRLDGEFAGPVKVMVTNPVYSQDRQHVLIPEGTFILGDAQKVSGFGQKRLAVVFHRLLMPDGYSVDLDQFHGLDQVGETGLKDKVNSHYLQIFGTSIALGIISGAAEATTNGGYSASGSDMYRQGMASSLAATGANVQVLLIGDSRQHQSVDAGKPFEQMQHAGMQTSQLDQIVRQKDPELLRAVEHLSRNETAIGLTLLQQQGRVTEIPDNVQRIVAIAKDYVARPENTLVVSPDNAIRQEINNAIRRELQASGAVSKEDHSMKVLTPRSDMTSVDRSWAARYQPDDILHYTRGSKEHGIEKGSYTTVVSVNHKENQITVQKPDGQQATYDPMRLQGIAAYREIEREFAQGDRIQFTANNRELAVSNRDMGTIERIDANQVSVKMDGVKERTVTFDAAQMRHFDHGYAVTSHSSQGLTADRVLVNMDTKVHPELINTRFAYVSVSRASEDVRIYTNDAALLSERLSTDVTKTSAVDLRKVQVEPPNNQQTQTKEPPMNNSREHSQGELHRQIIAETITRGPESINTAAEIEHRHNAPIQAALPKEVAEYEWKRETGEVQSYQHNHAGSWLHIDPQGQFYDRQAQPITRETALQQAGQPPAHAMGENTPLLSRNGSNDNDQGISL